MLAVLRLQLILLGALGAISTAAAAQFSYGSCETKGSKEAGLCIHIKDCPFLYEIFNTSHTTPEQRKLLSDSQCGLDNTRQSVLVQRILVCCPNSRPNMQVGATETGTSVENRNADELPEPSNVLPSNDNCGTLLSNRIYGGTKTELFEFPWMALLQYKKSDNELGFNCGGALINSRYVLTAGHCLASNKLEMYGWELHGVRLGEWDLTTAPDCVIEVGNKKRTCAPMHIDIEIEKKIPHELYVPNSIDQMHDIALLRLKRAVAYTDYVRPICLPVADEVRNSNFLNYSMDAAGWGITEDKKPSTVKLKISVDVWDLKKCQDKYRTYQMHINNSQLCAGGKQNIDTCQGDSGGPLMVASTVGMQEVFFVAGVTSYGPNPCGLPGWPGVYTRVGQYVDWVVNKLEA